LTTRLITFSSAAVAAAPVMAAVAAVAVPSQAKQA
jgi:hypothetical protein